MESINIALLFSAVSVLISVLTYNRNGKKDIKENTVDVIEVKTQLQYISRGVDDIKLNAREADERIKGLSEEVIIIKANEKSLNKRVEHLEDALNNKKDVVG